MESICRYSVIPYRPCVSSPSPPRRDNLAGGIYTRRPGQSDRATFVEELRSIEEDLAELAATSADVSTTGQPSPGRGPIALALNQARTEIAGAAALAEMARGSRQGARRGALVQAGARITVAAAFASRALAAGSTVGTG